MTQVTRKFTLDDTGTNTEDPFNGGVELTFDHDDFMRMSDEMEHVRGFWCLSREGANELFADLSAYASGLGYRYFSSAVDRFRDFRGDITWEIMYSDIGVYALQVYANNGSVRLCMYTHNVEEEV